MDDARVQDQHYSFRSGARREPVAERRGAASLERETLAEGTRTLGHHYSPIVPDTSPVF